MLLKSFNTTGACFPSVHYMVNIDSKLSEIRKLIDNGSYFVMNRPRQYGKTTTLGLLADTLKTSYIVISLDFQGLSDAKFKNEHVFSAAFAKDLLRTVRNRRFPVRGLNHNILDRLQQDSAIENESFGLVELFVILNELCETAEKPIVLFIDEVDNASNNQVFLDFLAQLRNYYLKRYTISTFQSVILAGVYDIKNLKLKIRSETEHRFNSPWNIAESFSVDMSFSADDIAGMLKDYENDHQTNMDILQISQCIFEYTSGYPFLVSSICKIMDEQFQKNRSPWTIAMIANAVNRILTERSTLFDSMNRQLSIYPDLRDILYRILFQGQRITFNPDNEAISLGAMFGYIFNDKGSISISNRIFEMRLYNLFLSEEELNSITYQDALRLQNQFIHDGKLNMDLVFRKFIDHFSEVYSNSDQKFIENQGRKLFLLYLKPIINGTGHYYVESQTRDMERTDIIVDYMGEQFIIELKIWRGPQYHEKGEKQLSDYLDRYQSKKGYLLTFNFNKDKEIGIREVFYEDKILIEGTV